MNSSLPPEPVSRRGAAEERLLLGVTEATDSWGFARLTVARVLAVAGVSRTTFYSYFSNVEDCFWNAYRHHAGQLTDEVKRATASRRGRELAVLDALGTFACSHPVAARMLMREGLGAGPSGLLERERLLANIVAAMAGADGQPSAVDLPREVLIGGAFRFIAMRLSDGSQLDSLPGELREWAGAFPACEPWPRWSDRLAPVWPEPSSPPALSGFRAQGPVRERIIRGAAMSIRAKGYQSVTVADIVTAAGVSRRRFYDEFPSKARAFVAAYELGFQQALAATTPAFFGKRGWREQVWNATLAFTGFLAREPLFAYLGFVECYAIGPDFTLRVHDIQIAFTLFLEDGYRERAEAESLPRTFSALTAATIFEVFFQASRRGPRVDIRSVQPLAVYIALAPFIGTHDAGGFVLQKLSMGRGDASAIA